MENSLLNRILQIKEFVLPNLSQLPQLNTSLKENPGFWNLTGGLGDEYPLISPYLTCNDKQEITTLEDNEIFQIAERLKNQAASDQNRKLMYKAALCYALVGVFGSTVETKRKCFEALNDLFKVDGLLADQPLQIICSNRTKPMPFDSTDLDFYKIVWSWTLVGKDKVEEYEKQRQDHILNGDTPPKIVQAFSLLGLVDSNTLDEKAIREACSQCKNQIIAIASLQGEQIPNNPLIKNFDAAVATLVDYLKLEQFNYEERIEPLKTSVTEKVKESISDQSAHLDICEKINKLTEELSHIAQLIKTNDSYLKPEIIEQHVGKKDPSDARFSAEIDTQKTADEFLSLIMVKILKIKKDGQELYNRIQNLERLTETDVNTLTACSSDIDSILNFLTKAKVYDFVKKYFSDPKVEADLNSLQLQLDQIKNKYGLDIKNRAAAIIALSKKLSAEPTNTSDSNLLKQLIEKQENQAEIAKSLLWLNALDSYASQLILQTHKTVTAQLQQSLTNYQTLVTQSLTELTKQYQEQLLSKITALKGKYQHCKTAIAEVETKINTLNYDLVANLKTIEASIPDPQEYQAIQALLPPKEQQNLWDNTEIRTTLAELEQLKADTDARYNKCHRSSPSIVIDAETFNDLLRIIATEKAAYEGQRWKHHADRHESLSRLNTEIETLTADTSISAKERTTALLKKIHAEELQTAQSHERIGFFGKYRYCRLQKMYLKILHDFKQFDTFEFRNDNDDNERHSKRCLGA